MLLRLLTLIALEVTACIPCSIGSFRLLWTKSPRSTAPLFRFVDGDKIGFIDNSGAVAISAQFDFDANETGDFVEGLARVKKNGKWGYIDQSGTMVIANEFESRWSLSDFSEGLARVLSPKLREGYGYIDKTGTLVIPYGLAGAGDFSGGLASFRESHRPREKGNMGYLGRAGYIDIRGAVVIKPRFAFAGPFREEVARIAVDGRCWIEGYAGHHLAAPSVPAMDSCGGPPADVKDHCMQGFIDKKGDMVISAKFTRATEFQEALAAVQEQDLWGYINHSGEYVIRPQFDEARTFSEGLAAVKQNGKWGFIDHNGTVVVPKVYTLADPFSDGVARVTKDKVLGYIDKFGAWVSIAPSDLATSFSFGLAHARLGTRHFGYFDKRGKLVFDYRDPTSSIN